MPNPSSPTKAAGELLPRYYVRTRYHVWTVMRRHDSNMPADAWPDSYKDTAVQHIGARGRGDAAARKLARETCDAYARESA